MNLLKINNFKKNKIMIKSIARNKYNQVIAVMALAIILVNCLIVKPIKDINKNIENQIKEASLIDEDIDVNSQLKTSKCENINNDIGFYNLISKNNAGLSIEIEENERRMLYRLKFSKDKVKFRDLIQNFKKYGKSIYIDRIIYREGICEVDIYKK